MGNTVPDFIKDLTIPDFFSNRILNQNYQAPPENIPYLQIPNSLQNNAENISLEIGRNDERDMMQKEESIYHFSSKSIEDINFSVVSITDEKEMNSFFISDDSKIGFDGSSSSLFFNNNELVLNKEEINSSNELMDLGNEFKRMFEKMDKDDNSYQTKYINTPQSKNIHNDDIIIDKRKKENNLDLCNEAYSISKDNIILQKSKDLSCGKNNISDCSKASTKDSINNANNNSILNGRKNPFVLSKYPENLISSNIKMNMSSCNLFCKIKRKRVCEKVIKPGKKLEEIEKPLLREFKNYLLKKKNEFEEIFDKDKIFWDQFLYNGKTPPFKYSMKGKEFNFKSFSHKLMNFIFSKEDLNMLYEKFVSDTNFHIQKRESNKYKNEYDRNAYETYLKNFNKIYNKNYKENDLILDDFD